MRVCDIKEREVFKPMKTCHMMNMPYLMNFQCVDETEKGENVTKISLKK